MTIPTATRKITTVMLENASGRGVCLLDYAGIARRAGVSRGTVWAVIAAGKDVGQITTVGRASDTIYRLLFNEPVECFGQFRPPGTWTDAKVARLREMYLQGMSAGVIAHAMGITLGSVNGKLRRLKNAGLAAVGTPRETPEGQRSAP